MGRDTLADPAYHLADRVMARENGENAATEGVAVRKARMNRQMPARLADAPGPEALGDEALSAEAGFRRYLETQEEFKVGLRTLVDTGRATSRWSARRTPPLTRC